jgi:hypothetical protein
MQVLEAIEDLEHEILDFALTESPLPLDEVVEGLDTACSTLLVHSSSTM